MQDRLDSLVEAIDAAAATQTSALDRIKAIMAAHYRFEMRHPKLFLAHIIAAFTPNLEPGIVPFGASPRTMAAAHRALLEGINSGEIDPAADVDRVIDVLCGVYAWNYRLAANETVDAEHLIALANRQADLIFDSIRQRLSVRLRWSRG